MKNTLFIDHKARLIVMDRTFYKNSLNTMSDEYDHLQKVRKNYPKYSVVRREIKKNENKKTYWYTMDSSKDSATATTTNCRRN